MGLLEKLNRVRFDRREGRKVALPNKPKGMRCRWQPELYLGCIAQTSVQNWWGFVPASLLPASTVGDPSQKFWVGASCPQVVVGRFGEFYMGKDYEREPWVTLQFTSSADPMYLVVEGEEIYLLSFPMGVCVIVGKLVRRNVLYRRVLAALGRFDPKI